MHAQAVTTATPQRISFVGGGSDFPDFYLEHGGAVLSTTIDKYIYVTVKRHSPLFKEKYRLTYSKTELVNSIEEIENDIARECLRLVSVEPPLYISTAADLPASSGLGSSSSFAVGLLHALHAFKGEPVSPSQLAEEACHVEMTLLNRPIGKQDQYAASFGGLNYIQFEKSGRVSIDHLWIPSNNLAELFKHTVLLWTGVQREAASILTEQKARISERTNSLKQMALLPSTLRSILLSKDFRIQEVGRLLALNWEEKKTLSSRVTDQEVDRIYEVALANGCIGGKVVGAGGGGFVLLLIPPHQQAQALKELDMYPAVTASYEPRGSRILYTI